MSDPGEWHPLCSVISRRVAHELGLVVLAMRGAYRITALENSWYLLEVQGGTIRRAPVQIGLYCEDVRKQPIRGKRAPIYRQRVPWWTYTAVYILLAGVFWLQKRPGGEWLVEMGRMDSLKVWQGEWWRVITPLFLHGDIGHLISNMGFGSLFAWFVIRRWGALRGWGYLFLTGVCGNLLLALTYCWTEHLSIGASTAVMGAIGLLAGASARERRRERDSGIGWLGPVGISLLGGMALFGLLGVGGERTDLVAHFWGWAVGLALGYCFHHQGTRTQR